MVRKRGYGYILLQLVCSLSLLFLTFAHRTNLPVTTSAGESAIAEAAALEILPQGIEFYICVTGSEDSQQFEYDTHCDACRVSQLVVLPEMGFLPLLEKRLLLAVLTPSDQQINKRQSQAFQHFSRGPPLRLS